METSRYVAADSNYFVSLFNHEDSRYPHAQTFAQKVARDDLVLVISNFIFTEIVTVLSQRRNRKVAIETGYYLLSEPAIRTVHVDEHLQNDAWQIFQEVEYKNVGFVDCSTIALMKSEGIHRLLTFDVTDFKKLQTKYRFSFYE